MYVRTYMYCMYKNLSLSLSPWFFFVSSSCTLFLFIAFLFPSSTRSCTSRFFHHVEDLCVCVRMWYCRTWNVGVNSYWYVICVWSVVLHALSCQVIQHCLSRLKIPSWRDVSGRCTDASQFHFVQSWNEAGTSRSKLKRLFVGSTPPSLHLTLYDKHMTHAQSFPFSPSSFKSFKV